MITEETARKQLEALHQEGITLAEEFGAEQRRQLKLYGKPEPKKAVRVVIIQFSKDGKKENKKDEKQVPEPPPTDETRFEECYRSWYSLTLPLM